jgi:putative ABC transport system ATP-binding protein
MSDISRTTQNGVISCGDVTRTIDTRSGARTLIDSFSYTFHDGTIYTVVGPSGAGKSSLLRLLNRLDEKSSGDLRFHDTAYEDISVTELRRKVALVFQVPYMFPGTVADNISYCCPDSISEKESATEDLLQQVGLEPQVARTDPEKLSVGQKQRVALARALVSNPEVLLLDEPTSALDHASGRHIEELIRDLRKRLKITIIMVTHLLDQAKRLGEESLILIDGTLIESGPTEDLMSNARSEQARKFLEGEKL